MIAFLLERTEINLFDQLWSNIGLLVCEGFHVADCISQYSPVSMDDSCEAIECILLDFWFWLGFKHDETYADDIKHLQFFALST